MTIDELKDWLGLKSGEWPRKQIVKGMRNVPVPTNDDQHIEAFKAFLKCAGAPRLAEPGGGR